MQTCTGPRHCIGHAERMQAPPRQQEQGEGLMGEEVRMIVTQNPKPNDAGDLMAV